MTTTTQTKEAVLAVPEFDLDVSGWLRDTVFGTTWKTVFAVLLIIANILIIRSGFGAEPVGLSFDLAPKGVPTAIGSLILTLTSGPLLTIIVLVLWLVGAATVIYSASRHHWPGPTQWLKDSIYNGPFGALTTLALGVIIIFAIRGVLSWTIFGAEFRTDPDSVAVLRDTTPGAIWGIIGANKKLLAVGQYPSEVIWRIWASLGIVLGLAGLSVLAWNFGSPLKSIRKPLVWGWVASIFVILFLLRGTGADTGPMQGVSTIRWGGFLLTIVIAIIGIGASFPIGVLLALGRRSETRGVPVLWRWGAGLLLIYWGLGNWPDDAVTLNIPLIFHDPPVWTVTLSPVSYAALQAFILVGIFWAVGYYLQGNMIKTFSVVFIEAVRGVPLITVLFMANTLLPLFLPKDLDIDNLLRVIVGVILFSAAYMAENVRGGLQAIPRGQYEAAMAVGLSGAQSMRLIILPQALRLVIPAIVGLFIGLFKDTTLVSIVGMFDLLQMGKTVVAQPEWLGLQRETFAFAALIYWVFAFSMSRASQRLERKLGVGKY